MASIADIPFESRPPLTLLGLDEDSPTGDDFYEHGWCRPPDVVLADASGQRRVQAPLVLALHTPDEPTPGPLLLEFWVWIEGEEVAVTVPWSSFAPARLPAVLGEEADVVLALCNPQDKPVAVPACLGARRFHYAHGDVRAWLEYPAEQLPLLGLQTSRWTTHG